MKTKFNLSKVALALLMLCNSVISFANNNNPDKEISIVGDVKSGDTHIPFATIVLKGTNKGTVTDESGHFMLNHLPQGTYTLRAQAVGYVAKEINIIISHDMKKKQFNFDLIEDNIGLDQVVVTADRNEISRKEAPVIVSSVSPKLLSSAGALCLAEGLNYTPGLRLETNCQNCGFTQVRMNGLEGPYTQILINSRPIMSGLAGVYGLEQYPASMIQRIEVVRGGGSSLFGGNAIAGTVNIITKDPVKNTFTAGISNQITGVGMKDAGTPSNDFSADFNASVISKDRKSGILVFGSTREKDHWDANDDGYSEISNIKNTSVGFNTFHRFSELSKLTIQYNGIKEDRRGGNKFNMLKHEADIAEAVEHNIHSGSIAYDHFLKESGSERISVYVAGQHLKRNSYYGAEQDKTAYGFSKSLNTSSGVQYFNKFTNLFFAPASFVAGIENNYETLFDEKLGAEGQPNATISDQVKSTYGGFIQNEWDFNFMKFMVGLRVDNYKIDDEAHNEKVKSNTVFIPRANLLFKLTDEVQLRTSYAMGYRAPQVFDEDLHIEVSGSRKIIHENDKNLVEEKSQSFTGSIDYTKQIGNSQLYFLAEGFYTKLSDPFVNEYDKNETTGITTAKRINSKDNAVVTGVNLEIKYAPSKKINFQGGLTIQKSEYDNPQDWGEHDEYESESDKMLRAPNTYGYAMIDYKFSHAFKVSVSANYTGAMYAPHFGINMKDPELSVEDKTMFQKLIDAGDVIEGEELVKTKSFVELGAKLSYHFDVSKDIQVELSGGVKNILNSYQDDFDRGINRDAGWIYGPGTPRTIYFSLKFGNIF